MKNEDKIILALKLIQEFTSTHNPRGVSCSKLNWVRQTRNGSTASVQQHVSWKESLLLHAGGQKPDIENYAMVLDHPGMRI